MDFDSSKENIQPLRGGRNPLQLSFALNAQGTEDANRELVHQKEEYENAIRNYQGDDPLQNWYDYISWIEQSFPKHGYEGNLLTLLEDCLSKFEHDKRYYDDRRLCKLFIKYIDMQQNPLELYNILHARGLCRGITDLYRAWAYYHEAAGDYKSADAVFQMGRRELAQPANELDMAHRNLIFAAGVQVISGINESRLIEQRMALTSLHTYKPGVVTSVRLYTDQIPTLPCTSTEPRSNASIHVYHDVSEELGATAALPSVLSIARRQDPKENLLHPGVWTQSQPKRTTSFHTITPFKIHEDRNNDPESDGKGLRLPMKFYSCSNENYTNWNVELFVQDPYDHTKIPMYPKALVYNQPMTEYSIEELKAQNYLNRMKRHVVHQAHPPPPLPPAVEVAAATVVLPMPALEQTGTNVLPNDLNNSLKGTMNIFEPADDSVHRKRNVMQINNHALHHNLVYQETKNYNLQQKDPSYHNLEPDYHNNEGNYQNQPPFQFYTDDVVQPQQQLTPGQHHLTQGQHQMTQGQHQLTQGHHQLTQGHHQLSQGQHQLTHEQHQLPQEQHLMQNPYMVNHYQYEENQPPPLMNQNQSYLENNSYYHHQQSKYNLAHDIQTASTHHHMQGGNNFHHVDCYETDFNYDISNSGFNLNESDGQIPFGICEASNAPQVPRGTALKTPLKDISTDDLAETGSRGGLEIAAAAQPCDEAKRITIFEDDIDTYAPHQRNINLDDSLNTRTFQFNLNNLQVSTPNSKMPFRDCVEIVQPKNLSMIREESAGYEDGSANAQKSKESNSSSLLARNLVDENSYHYNLAQNRKANEELRTSLLEFMDCESHPSSPVTETLPQPPIKIKPLERVPSDPFKPALIQMLLDRMAFPGHHMNDFNSIYSLPKLNVKKESVLIGQDRYVVEKTLGKGTYGSVFKAVNDGTKQVVALKLQKPANKWEYYICKELQVRLAKQPLRDRFMNIEVGYYCNQGSVIVSKYGPNGSLLDLTNMIKQKFGRTMKESLCVYFCLEMLKIVEAMHEVKIIHADIKPDNFLVFIQENNIKLQLIDFGCSIDMSLLPDNANFMRSIKTENFTCCEMLDGRPWNYHTDLFCIGATAHVLLFDKYITLQKVDNQWSLTQKFTRYWNVPLWTEFFNALLNQQNRLADTKYLQMLLEDNLHNMNDFNSDIRALKNILKTR